MSVIRLSILCLAFASAGLPAPAPEADFEAAFDRLKTLVGTWDERESGRTVQYHLTGSETSLIEEFAGDPPMATLYHMDGRGLRLTHYCNAGNQPRMRALSYDEQAGVLAFEFVDVTNLSAPGAYHTRELTIRFLNADHVVLDFVGLKEGQSVATTHTLTRRSPTAAVPDGSYAEPEALSRTDAEQAFDMMKNRLVGEWRGQLVEIDSPVEATFYLTGNGSALVEDVRRPDRPASRMHSVYHLADDQLRVTHYCSYRNQPRLVAAGSRDGGTTIEFRLEDVTNLSRSGNRYTHRMIVSAPDSDHASIVYMGLDEGQEGALTAELTRVR